HGIRVLGIDPSSATNIAIEKGIPTDVVFFNEGEAHTVAERMGKPKIITATNVFAHVKELDSFMRGITALLAPDGVFISESGYVADMIEGMQYDSIYHEHLRYYSVTSLAVLFGRFQMEIINVERIPSHGGSIRVYAARKGAHPASPLVQQLISTEKQKCYTALPIYTKFAEDIAKTKLALLNIIFGLKKKNCRIAGIGAPAKGNTILNYCQLNTDTIEYLAEKSALKIGLYSPGMHIPVVDESRLFEDMPEAALLLSWNLADELIPKLRQAGFRGQFIVPNPIPRLV
ncbi:MAG: class I SAM-dependent methyltransferase, partial [bacterium]|nr:class I SAM-dependent methyltransferase [bacterium]